MSYLVFFSPAKFYNLFMRGLFKDANTLLTYKIGNKGDLLPTLYICIGYFLYLTIYCMKNNAPLVKFSRE